jgi:intein/homing endonuclease
MSGKKPNVDYIDTDVAYLVGMIVARGSFHQDGDVRRLVIQFPYRHDAMTPLPDSQIEIDRETALRLSLDSIRARISELLEVNLRVVRKAHEVSLFAVFPRETIGWRDLRFITGAKSNYLEFDVPQIIFDSDSDIQKEFLRGIADTSCEPSYADRYHGERQRIVIQVQFGNWVLPIQLCKLLQEYLNIPVSNILWGHPNLRTPSGGSGWTKETRIRIFAEAFEPIGFYFEYKQRIFEEMVRFNKERGDQRPRVCNPKTKKLRGRKRGHEDECSERLPECLRGKHFNSYYKICRALGCKQGKKGPQRELFSVGEED